MNIRAATRLRLLIGRSNWEAYGLYRVIWNRWKINTKWTQFRRLFNEGWVSVWKPPPPHTHTHTHTHTISVVSGRGACWLISSLILFQRFTVIYSDSGSCSQALQGKQLEHLIIRGIVHILTYLEAVGSRIEFCWLPGHIGIRGNEKADNIAKRVIDNKIHDIKLPFSDLKPRIC